MKLRVRIRQQTSRLEVGGAAPTVKELVELVGQTLLPPHGLSVDTDFRLSLNGSDPLSDSTQTLQACGIDSGDLIWVLLPQSRTGSSSSTVAGAEQSSSSAHSQGSDAMEHARPSPSDAGAAPLWEPILCSEAEDGHAPLSLDLLFHTAQVSCPNDAAMVAVHTLMLEAGFMPPGCESRPAQMPAGWRSGNSYRLQYAHPLCSGSSASVVGVVMGPQLVINAALTVLESVALVRKLQLTASSFVTEEWAGGSAAAAFKDLRKLSRLVKDQLAYPLIAAAREAVALPWAFGLQALPPELLLRVLRLLDVRSLVRLSAVCRLLNAAAADSSLWRHLYHRDFPGSDGHGSRDSDWKQLYKRSFVCRAESRRSRALLVTPPPFGHHICHPVPRPFPPVPGIIGGDYDQRPDLPHGLLPRPRHDPIGPLADPFGRPRPRFRPSGGGADVRRGFI